MTGLQVCTGPPAGRPACPCRPLQTPLNLSQHPWEGKGGGGEAGEERQVFPTPPSLRAGGVGEGRPRPPEAAVRSRQGGQTWVPCKNRAAAAATAHGFTQQQLSLPMWLAKSKRPLRWGPGAALNSQTSGQPMHKRLRGCFCKRAIASRAGFILLHSCLYSTLPNRTHSSTQSCREGLCKASRGPHLFSSSTCYQNGQTSSNSPSVAAF